MRQIVSILLIRNEDRFIGQVLQNIEKFCDRIIIANNGSSDDTGTIIERWARQKPCVSVHNIRNPAESHKLIAGYAGSDTWVFGVDGDELYEPNGLANLRNEILTGKFQEFWRVVGHSLHCDSLEETDFMAKGYMSPPSRTATKLYNFSMLESWEGGAQRLHGGEIRFQAGFSDSRQYRYFDHCDWDQSGFRCLHMAFLRRSSLQDASVVARPNVSESWGLGFRARIRNAISAMRGLNRSSSYKDRSYRQGNHTTVDARPFFAQNSVVVKHECH